MNKAVLNKEVQDYINCHLQADVHQLAMAKSPFAEVSSRELATQISAKRKSEKKLPTWYATPFIYYPEPLSIEQSSSEKTAAYKASLLAKGSVLDLTGGFGVDSYYFSKRAERVVHCEINTGLSEIVFNNLKALKTPNIECIAGDGLAYLKSIPDYFGSIYIDPARRSHSGKVFLLQDCTPNVIEHLDLLLNRATRVILKAAPLLDISAALKELSHVAQIHIVSAKNECKELLFILEKDAKGPVKITSTALNDSVKQFSFSKEDPIEIHFPSAVATYLYEPDVALLKSGGFYQIALQYDLLKLEEQTQLYTSEEYKPEFPGRIFKVEELLQAADLKKNKNLSGNVIVRNYPAKAEELVKKYKIKSSDEDFLLFTKTKYTGLQIIRAKILQHY